MVAAPTAVLYLYYKEARNVEAGLSQKLSRTSARLESVFAAYVMLSEALPTSPDTVCAPEKGIVAGQMLKVQTTSTTKVISDDVLLALLNKRDMKVGGVVYSRDSIREDAQTLADVTIDREQDKKQTVISYSSPEKARSFDFVVSIEDTDDAFLCHQTFRLFFGSPTDLEDGWQVIGSIGRSGLGLGRFSLPYGTQFVDNALWTTDCTNENISVFSLSGGFVSSFGKFGSRLGDLDTPADIRVLDDLIYVVEERNHRVQVFNRSGEPVDSFGAYKSVIGRPEDSELFTDKFDSPLGIAMNDDTIVVVDYGNNRVLGYDHAFQNKWASTNQDPGPEWKNPYYAEWSPVAEVFAVSNRSADNIMLLGPDGEKLRNIGVGVLSYPHEVTFNAKGDILIADMKNHQVVLFEKSTNYETHKTIKFPKSYGLPKTLAVVEDDVIVVGFIGNGTAFFLILGQKVSEERKQAFFELTPTQTPFRNAKTGTIAPASSKTGVENLRLDASAVYSQYCSSCHENGDYDAPARGNIEAWERFPRDMDTLLELAIVGEGGMIPRGGCSECSDELLRETIEFMLPMTWNAND